MFDDGLLRAFKDLIKRQENLRESFESQAKTIIEAQDSYKALIGTTAHDIIAFQNKFKKLIFPDIIEQIKHAANDVEEFKFIMLTYGFPPHYDIDIDIMRNIANCYKTSGTEETETLLNDVFEQTFTKEVILGYLDHWISINWLEDRHTILSEGINAHITGKYYAAISTLLPQLEGILISKVGHSGWISQKKLKHLIESVFDETGTFSLDDTVKLFYLDIVLTTFLHGKVITSPLSRHAILHGGDTRFGYKLNSIKCIILFDYLIKKLEEETPET